VGVAVIYTSTVWKGHDHDLSVGGGIREGTAAGGVGSAAKAGQEVWNER